MKNILEVKNLTKKYEDGTSTVIALDKVSLNVKYGEDIAILGPSGSGKTTFLQLAGGLDKATSGSVIVDDKNLEDMSDKEVSEFRNKEMGFIFQMIHLQDFFTAKENIMLPLLVAGKERGEAEKKAKLLLKKVGLSDREDHLPRQLSGGEQQRVAVARALANDPKLIFADEPTGKLDKDNSKMVIDLLENLSKENGLSVVIITHDPNVAKRFSKTIKIEHGKIVSTKTN